MNDTWSALVHNCGLTLRVQGSLEIDMQVYMHTLFLIFSNHHNCFNSSVYFIVIESNDSSCSLRYIMIVL